MNTAECPNCHNSLGSDLLDGVMNQLENRNHITISFSCNNCKFSLKAYNEVNMYYIKNPDSTKDDLFIGAK